MKGLKFFRKFDDHSFKRETPALARRVIRVCFEEGIYITPTTAHYVESILREKELDPTEENILDIASGNCILTKTIV